MKNPKTIERTQASVPSPSICYKGIALVLEKDGVEMAVIVSNKGDAVRAWDLLGMNVAHLDLAKIQPVAVFSQSSLA